MSQKASGKADSGTDPSSKEFTCSDCGKSYTNNSNLARHKRKAHLTDDIECPVCSESVATEHGLKVHIGRKHEEQPEPSEECPTCGDMFLNERSVAVHHKKAHGESIAGTEYQCDWCGSKVVKNQCRDLENVFCDRDCFGSYRSVHFSGSNSPNYNRVTTECEWCGTEYDIAPYREGNSKYCSQDCKDQSLTEQTGEDHPRWKGGAHENYRGDWYETRKKALKRDGNQCVICGEQSEVHVHHIKPVNDFDDPNEAHTLDNVVCLCRSHHYKWEGLYLKPDIR